MPGPGRDYIFDQIPGCFQLKPLNIILAVIHYKTVQTIFKTNEHEKGGENEPCIDQQENSGSGR
jgi:hypothetical protein